MEVDKEIENESLHLLHLLEYMKLRDLSKGTIRKFISSRMDMYLNRDDFLIFTKKYVEVNMIIPLNAPL